MKKQKDETPVDEESRHSINLTDNKEGKKKGAYTKLKRDLEEDDLSLKGAQKLILNDLDRLTSEVKKLKKYRKLFHQKNIECSIQGEQIKAFTGTEVFQTIVLTIGGLLLGIAPSIWVLNGLLSIVVCIASIILLLGVFIAKFTNKKDSNKNGSNNN